MSKTTHRRTASQLRGTGLTFKNQMPRNLGFSEIKNTKQLITKNSTISENFFSRHASEGQLFDSQYNTSSIRSKAEVDVDKKKSIQHTIDFAKTLPRETFKPVKVSKSKACQAYVVNFTSVDKKNDKLCIPFAKAMGRSDIKSEATGRTDALGKKLDLLAKLQKEVSKNPTVSTAREKSKETKADQRGSQSKIGGRLISMDKSLPRCRDPANALPSWMQKEASFNRLGLEVMGEKSIEINSFRTGKIRSYRENTFGSKPQLNKKYKIDQADQSSDEDLYDMPSVDD